MNYLKHHDLIISRARGRILTGYKERHHVIPKCMGGDNSKGNLVDLTPEEHFVIHQLLVKIHPNVFALVNAAMFMAKKCTGNKSYGWLRRKVSGYRKGRPLSPEHRANLSVANRGKKLRLGSKHTDHTRQLLSMANSGKKRSEAQKIAAKSRPPMTDETKAKLSKAVSIAKLGGKHTNKAKEKMRQAHLGKVLTSEHRKKISDGVVVARQRQRQSQMYGGYL